jgi:hypothetical protein
VENSGNSTWNHEENANSFACSDSPGVAALPTSAEARWGWGGFGVSLATGAMIGGALARPYYPYYGYGYSYPAYYTGCYWRSW